MLLTKSKLFPSYRFGPSAWKDFPTGTRREWLITNGIGGFASSSIIGTNTRRYHGLLVSGLPFLDRHLLLAKVDEEISCNNTFYSLSTSQYRNSINPQGFQYIAAFAQSPFPTWLFQIGAIVLKKTIFMVYGKNSTVFVYELLESPTPINLLLKLFVTQRNFHHLLRADSKKFEHANNGNQIEIRTPGNTPFLYVKASTQNYYHNGEWYFNFQYLREKERGLDFEEDLFHSGTFSQSLSPGEKLYLVASTEPIPKIDAEIWQEKEKLRFSKIVDESPIADENLEKLILASETYALRQGKNPVVVAGYPWLSEADRDSLIAIPGLFLIQKKFDEAFNIIEKTSLDIQNGLLANTLGDNEISLGVDTPLWLFYAVYKTYQYTHDNAFIEKILPTLESIIQTYYAGKKALMGMGPDYLIYAEDPENELTWMDAKIGHHIFTPRRGACIEVNALWYNALKVMEQLSSSTKKPFYSSLSKSVSESFLKYFWNPGSESLYDRISSSEGSDSSVRPNQIFAISLPFSMIPKEKGRKILNCVTTSLYTPYGLRTLAPDHANYQGTYQGDRWLRDRALHQGAVWSWLLGPYMTALVNIEGEAARSKVIELLSPILAHLYDAGIGHISEIFWGDFPHQAAGCIAKAWSVAEVLRAYVEDGLGLLPL